MITNQYYSLLLSITCSLHYSEQLPFCRQVTLSYGGFDNRKNVVPIVGGFSLAEDPTR